MSYCRRKTRYIAEISIREYLRRESKVYWWTFTEPGRALGKANWNKTEAETALKPFLDLCRRRGHRFLVVWELQARLSWHPHILVNGRFDVAWLRPWMMERGWGQQMFVKYIVGGGLAKMSSLPLQVRVAQEKLTDYLTKSLRKYLLKAKTDDREPRKKFFCGTRESVVASLTVRDGDRWSEKLSKFIPRRVKGWDWNPWLETAHAYLYARGRSLYYQMFQSFPTFRDFDTVIGLGVRDTSWLDVDFLFEAGWSAAPP